MMEYQGVILAAGKSSRMGPFGHEYPKPIAPIANCPLIAYHLDQLHALGIRDVTIVIGHLGHRIIETLGDGAHWGVKIRYVEQEKRLGLAHAVSQVEPYIERPFVLFLGDVYFEVERLERLLEEHHKYNAAAVLAVRQEQDPAPVRKNFTVTLDGHGNVRRVIEKPRVVHTLLKGCGLYLFDQPIFDAIRRTPRTALRDEYELTESIQILINDGYIVRATPVVTWDMNLTFLHDLITCNVYALHKRGVDFLSHDTARLGEGVHLRDSVVGPRAQVPAHTTLERCVVLPDGVVPTPGLWQDAVFSKDGPLSPTQPQVSENEE